MEADLERPLPPLSPRGFGVPHPREFPAKFQLGHFPRHYLVSEKIPPGKNLQKIFADIKKMVHQAKAYFVLCKNFFLEVNTQPRSDTSNISNKSVENDLWSISLNPDRLKLYSCTCYVTCCI